MNKKLIRILQHAQANVPYYAHIFEGLNFNENFSADQFKKLPVLERSILFREKEKFIAGNIDKSKLLTETTSGSTGNFLTYYRTLAEHILGGKILLNLRKQCCPDIDKIKGVIFHPGETFEDKNYFYPSLLDFSIAAIEGFLEYISSVDAVWISSPCSALFKFAQFIKKTDKPYNIKSVKFIELNAEKVIDYQRKFIQEVFQCPVRNYYGCREVWGIAYECKENKLHVIGNNVFLETINDKENMASGTQKGELLITGYNNYAMPFIRYRTGDIGRLTKSDCPCGNTDDILEELDGRINDFIYVDSNKSIHSSFIELVMSILYSKGENPLLYQLVQHTPYKFTLKLCFDVIKNKKFVEGVCRSWFKGFLGSKFKLKIKYVREIARNSRTGKFQYFVSELNQ